MKLNVNDPKFFNQWRSLYSELTDEEQKELYNELEKKYPHQQHFTRSNYDLLFSRYPNKSILEAGGWKGELAQYCFSKYQIKSWKNIEVCQSAIDKTVPINGNYFVENPQKFDWFNDFSKISTKDIYDIFISAHTIEHLCDKHLIEMLEAISQIKVIMLEAPISRSQNDWHNYTGTHILNMGWNQIDDIMRGHGYNVEIINADCALYVKT